MTEPTRFRPPTTEAVHAALARLGNLQTQRVFYSKLLNPLWVTELAKAGAFRNPPAAVVSADGSTRVSPWPQAEYLARMVEHVPAEVATIFRSIIDTNNPWVRRSIAEGVARLPAETAADLVPGLRNWATDTASSVVDPRDIARIIVNLMEGSQATAGVELARAYYRPRQATVEPVFGLPEPQVGVDDYMYEQTLPMVATAMGDARLAELIDWLEDYQRFANSYDSESKTDTSYIWRPSITRGSGSGHEVGDALVDAVREAAIVQFDADANTAAELLMRSDHQLVRRIALDVCAEAIEKDSDARPRPDRAALASISRQLLGDPAHGDVSLRVEYVRLVRACLALPGAYSVTAAEDLVERGPTADIDRLRAFYSERHPEDSEGELQQRVDGYIAHWRHRLLAGVGRDGLTPQRQLQLDELDGWFGPIESPAEPAWRVTDVVGEQSALSDTEMRSMSDEAVLQHLLTWDPEPQPGIGMTYEATGRALASVLALSPDRFVAAGLAAVQALRPTYIRSMLTGWRDAVKAGIAVPWDFVLDLSSWVSADHPDPEQEGETETFDGDSTLRNAKMEVARLVVEAASASRSVDESILSSNQLESAANILLALAAWNPDLSPSSESGMDPLTASLNYVRPEAARGLVRMTRWPLSPEMRTRILDDLEACISEDDRELAIAAVLGEGIGRLYESARDWLAQHAVAIFGGEGPSTRFQQTALSTALATHNSHPALVTELRPSLTVAIGELGGPPLAIGWSINRSFVQLIGDWLVIEYVTGRMTQDDPLFDGFFARAAATDRGAVVGHLAWSMMHVEHVSEEVLARARALWELRMRHVAENPEDAAELAEFYWFVRSGKFDSSWWLPQLVDVLAAYPRFNPKGMIGEQIAAVAQDDPRRALEVVAALANQHGTDESMDRYHLIESTVPSVIAAALDSPSADLRVIATRLMSDLGQRGHVTLADQVRAARKPTA